MSTPPATRITTIRAIAIVPEIALLGLLGRRLLIVDIVEVSNVQRHSIMDIMVLAGGILRNSLISFSISTVRLPMKLPGT
jgi:hypothetical protein